MFFVKESFLGIVGMLDVFPTLNLFPSSKFHVWSMLDLCGIRTEETLISKLGEFKIV